MHLRQLLARREEIRAAMVALVDAHPDGPMPADAAAKFDALKAEAEGLTGQEQRLAALADMEQRAAGRPVNTPADPARMEVRAFGQNVPMPQAFDGAVLHGQDGSRVPVLEARHSLASFLPAEQRASEIGIGGMLRALALGPANDMERRVLSEQSAGAGSVTLPTPLSAAFLDLLRARTTAFRAGVRTVPMSTASLRFATLTADPVGGWRPELGAVVEGTPAFGSQTLAPKSYAFYVRISRELLADGQDVGNVVQASMVRAAALAVDQAIYFGTGTNNQPQGIVGTSGVTVIDAGTNGATPTDWSLLTTAVLDVQTANDDPTAIVWAPRTAKTYGTLADTTHQPLRAPAMLDGLTQLVTTAIPVNQTHGSANTASSAIVGNFSDVIVGVREAVNIQVLNERFLTDSGSLAFLLNLRMDVLVQRPASLAVITGLLP